MVGSGAVRVDDMTATTDQRVYRGQRVSMRLVEPPDKLLRPSLAAFGIVYEDPWVLVVNKPAGLIAHPVGDFQEDALINAVQHHLDQQACARGVMRAGIVHRLDRMTSGLMVVVKDHMSHRMLSIDFQNGRPQKRYLALIGGQPDFETCTLTKPIGLHPTGRSVLMSAQPDARRARDARTDVVVRKRFRSCALVECRLHTGRNHQIRVHLADIGHPVLGDEFYGAFGKILSQPAQGGQLPTEQRHALHATLLRFNHPVLQTELSFLSPPPEDFWQLMSLAGGKESAP